MGCLTYGVNVIIEGQCIVYNHAEALYCSCNRNSNVSNCDIVDFWFRPLSCSGLLAANFSQTQLVIISSHHKLANILVWSGNLENCDLRVSIVPTVLVLWP